MIAAMAWTLGTSAAGATTKKPVKLKAASVRTASKPKAAKGKVAARNVKGKAGTKAAAENKIAAAERTAATERTIRLNSDFVATAQLRPMAQQLASSRRQAAMRA